MSPFSDYVWQDMECFLDYPLSCCSLQVTRCKVYQINGIVKHPFINYLKKLEEVRGPRNYNGYLGIVVILCYQI